MGAWTAINDQNQPPRAEPPQQAAQQNIPEETLGDPAHWQPITWFTLFLVFVGAGQAVLFFWQLSFLRSADETARRAANAARKAADAAALSANAVVGVEIARIEVVNGSLEFVFDPETMRPSRNGSSISIEFFNHGRTGGIILEYGLDWSDQAFPPTRSRYFEENIHPANLGETLAAGTNTRHKRVFVATKATFDKLTTDNGILWVRGYIAYVDFLGSHWRTEFMLIYNHFNASFRRVDGAYDAECNGRYRYDPTAPRGIQGVVARGKEPPKPYV